MLSDSVHKTTIKERWALVKKCIEEPPVPKPPEITNISFDILQTQITFSPDEADFIKHQAKKYLFVDLDSGNWRLQLDSLNGLANCDHFWESVIFVYLDRLPKSIFWLFSFEEKPKKEFTKNFLVIFRHL